MADRRPILSILIPTYNRATEIEGALNSIVRQEGLGNIEIIISDNASTDNTEKVVKEFQSKYRFIKYSKLEENIGPDGNFLKVVELANGEYCYFLSSDDELKDGAILKFLNIFQSSDIDIFLFNRENWLNMKVFRGQEVPNKLEITVDAKEMARYIDQFDTLLPIFSFLSVIAFKKTEWSRVVELENKNIQKYIGSHYIHVFVLMSILKHGGILNYKKDVVVKNRLGNSFFLENSGYFKRILIDYAYLDIAKETLGENVSLAVKRLLNRKNNTLVLLRAKYYLSENEYDEFEEYLGGFSILKRNFVKFFPLLMIKTMLRLNAILAVKR